MDYIRLTDSLTQDPGDRTSPQQQAAINAANIAAVQKVQDDIANRAQLWAGRPKEESRP